MSKVLGTVAAVASVAALFLPPPFNAIAQTVAVVASVGATLTQKKPGAQGSVNEVRIGANLPTPYAMGRTYIGGNRMHDAGYGGKVNGVDNPYRSMVDVWSLGPVEQIEAFQADFETVTFAGANAVGYYANFLYLSKQLGLTPEASALTGPWGAIPSWGASSKLSGLCAGLASLKFDKKGKIYASGVPQFGVVLKGVRAYDMRKDSTYPGGSGSHRWDDESSWEWTENPALHAATYARGRYQNGKKVFGCGFPADGIDLAPFAAWANVCDANGWKIGGVIYEPGSRWDNLKRICEAGGAEPCFVGARLSVRYWAPKVGIDTIEAVDLADGDYEVPAMRSWRDRKNKLIPKYRSEAHKWEQVQAEAVTASTYVEEDGEEKEEEYPIELVTDVDQATQLTAYRLVNLREFGPIVLPCKPRMINYKIGEALIGGDTLEELGLAGQLLEITARTVDPATGIVTLTLASETTAKHAFALGQTGTAPPTPSLTSGEDLDETTHTNSQRPEPFEVVDEAAQLALNAAQGDTAVRLDQGKTYVHNGGAAGTMADWTELQSPAAPVSSVNGDTGAVLLAAADIPFIPAGTLSSMTTQAAIEELDSEKASTVAPTFTGQPVFAGGGMKFPAAAVPSGDPNALDDYEEGVFTPALTFATGNTGITYNVANTAGRYTKVGRAVFYELNILLTSKGSSTGIATITGLPFTAAGNPASPGAVFAGALAGMTVPIARVLAGSSNFGLYNFTGSTVVVMTDANFTNTSSINIAGHYHV